METGNGGGGGGEGGEVPGGGGGGEKGEREGERGGEGDSLEGLAGEAEMRLLLLAKKQSVAEMEREKDRLQARCRELQVEKGRGQGCVEWPLCVTGRQSGTT